MTNIELKPNDNLESVVYTLLAAKARGEKACCVFNGVMLYSDTVTMASAFRAITSYSDVAYQEKATEELKNNEKAHYVMKRTKEQRELLVMENRRTHGVPPITKDLVVEGLKFIAENQKISQDELFDGLLELGFNFTLKDFDKESINNVNIDRFSIGDIVCGAAVVLNARDDSEYRHYINDRLLGLDDDTSIYHYIRTVTGDNSYTKEYVDSLSKGKVR